jgi:hypothetical protein
MFASPTAPPAQSVDINIDSQSVVLCSRRHKSCVPNTPSICVAFDKSVLLETAEFEVDDASAV